jgi:hypothetical protein
MVQISAQLRQYGPLPPLVGHLDYSEIENAEKIPMVEYKDTMMCMHHVTPLGG